MNDPIVSEKQVASWLWMLSDLLEAEHLRSKVLGIETNVETRDYVEIRRHANRLWESH